MASRTVNVGVMSYLNLAGQPQFGLLGQEVEVSDDDVERFDRYNGEPAETEQAEQTEQADIDAEQAEKPATRRRR